MKARDLRPRISGSSYIRSRLGEGGPQVVIQCTRGLRGDLMAGKFKLRSSSVFRMVIGKGDELPIIPVTNRRQWVRKDPGARKIDI